MSKFKLSIILLENRWADLKIIINNIEHEICFEFCPIDSLLDILESAIKIINNRDSEIVFCNGPSRIYLYVKILEYKFCKIIFEDNTIIISIKDYCRAVIQMYDKYIYSFSIQDFKNNWCEYPHERLLYLKELFSLI